MGQSGAARNEIFVDILERLTMLFAANGSVVNSTIDGCIQMKSYLAGNPELRLALNEDLVVGKGGPYGTVCISVLRSPRRRRGGLPSRRWRELVTSRRWRGGVP